MTEVGYEDGEQHIAVSSLFHDHNKDSGVPKVMSRLEPKESLGLYARMRGFVSLDSYTPRRTRCGSGGALS